MAYTYDNDLEFMRSLKSSDLNDLVELLTKDKDGDTRLTESLTGSDLYKKFHPDHIRYIDLIFEEIQTFGGNSFVNKIRGGGVLYREILRDVCDKMKVNYNTKSSTQVIENNLFMKILEDAMQQMTPEQLKEIVGDLNLKTTNFTSQGVMAALQTAIRLGGFMSYQITVIVANAIWKFIFGRGLSLAGNAALTRAISIFAGPIGWAITGIWTAIDIAGPAYRVTIPAVIQIAYLRAIQEYEQD